MNHKKLNTFALLMIALVLALAACVPAPTLQSVEAPTATETPTSVPLTSTPVPTSVPPTSTPTPEIALDTDALGNLAYRSEWVASGTAPLTDGKYSEAAAPGSATKTTIQLHDLVAFGNTADGQPLAAVILVTNPGGSGTFYDLAAVTIRDGELVHAATAHLGDRTQIESLAIENGEVIVEMVTQGPDDPMCCPTQRVVVRYALQDDLVQVSSEALPDTSKLADIVWEWERFLGGDGSVVEVQDPSRYTLILNPDGTYQVRADCNRLGGTYTLAEGSLLLHPGPMTLAECEPGSLYSDFLAHLGDVRTYVMDGDRLVLDLWADAGQMVFRPVQAVQLPEVESDLVGITWEWVQFLGGDDSRTDVDDPSRYTLTLNPDGTYQLKADCNTSVGAYTWDEAHLELKPGPTTLAECAPGSLYSEFLAKLGHVRTYVFDDGKLVLDLWADAGQMIFRQAGTAGLPAKGDALDIDVRDITLDTQGLPYAWQPVYVPAAPYDASMPPGPKGLPAHIEILFGVTDLADRQFGEPIMYIIPVDAYQQMWGEAGNTAVADTLNQIADRTFVTNLPGSVTALPFEEIVGRIDLAAQVGRAVPFGQLNETSAVQSGYRFVGRWAQDANPVTNQNLTYVYQGFTNDGRYLMSFFCPVSTEALPSVDEVSQKEIDRLRGDYEAYMAEKTELLNGLDSADFVPNLAILDALVASLEIDGMPVSGLQDKAWHWISGPAQPGSSEVITLAHPELYQVTYTSDGAVEIVADCNRASLSYELRQGGLVGGMLTMPGPMTLAECGPESHYRGFVFSLEAAQTYRVHPGGNELSLILPAGGGELVFRNAGQPAATPSLKDTLWQLVAYADDQGNLTDVLPNTEILAELFEGQIAGSAGCNRYTASYTIEGDTMTFGLVASTRMMCASPDGIMEQEQGYLAALGSVKAYRISGDSLDLIDVDGALLATFVASAAQDAP